MFVKSCFFLCCFAAVVALVSGNDLRTTDDSRPFFLGTFLFNVTIERQTNWWAVYTALGLPTWLYGEPFTITISRAGHKTFHIVETASSHPKFVFADWYFQLGRKNTTLVPDNVEKEVLAKAVDDHTLQIRLTEVVSRKTVWYTLAFSESYRSCVLTFQLGAVKATRPYRKVYNQQQEHHKNY